MKKIYAILFLISCSAHFAMAGAGCTIDSSNTGFFSPSPDSLPCIERNVPYSQVIQILVPNTIDLQQFGSPIPFILTVDSMVVDSVTGLPSGIDYILNPDSQAIYGGGRACALLSGTTTDAKGNYPVIFYGTITMHGFPFPPYFDGDTTVRLEDVQSAPQSPFKAAVDVINPGDTCRPASAPNSVKSFNNELNTALFVYPNPGNGLFEVKLTTGRRINGIISVVDLLGREIYREDLDVFDSYSTRIDLKNFAKGIYTLLLKTNEGVAAKNISIE